MSVQFILFSFRFLDKSLSSLFLIPVFTKAKVFYPVSDNNFYWKKHLPMWRKLCSECVECPKWNRMIKCCFIRLRPYWSCYFFFRFYDFVCAPPLVLDSWCVTNGSFFEFFLFRKCSIYQLANYSKWKKSVSSKNFHFTIYMHI